MIFIDVLSKEMGLKSDALTAPSHLGMREIREPMILCTQISPEKKAEQRL